MKAFLLTLSLLCISNVSVADVSQVIGISLDRNQGQLGFGDKRGDLKFIHLTTRIKNTNSTDVIYVGAGLITPQRSINDDQLDTAPLSIYAGQEYKSISVYAGLDIYNGPVLDFAQESIKFIHSLYGTSTRVSPASSSLTFNPAIKFRIDQSMTVYNVVSFHAVGFGKASMHDNYVSVGGFARLGLDGKPETNWKPDFMDMPQQGRSQSDLYIGITGSYVLDELITNNVGTEKWRSSIHAGGTLKLNDAITLGLRVNKYLTSTVSNPLNVSGSTKPVEEFHINLHIKM